MTRQTDSCKIPLQLSGHMIHLMAFFTQTGLLRVALAMAAVLWLKPPGTQGSLTS